MRFETRIIVLSPERSTRLEQLNALSVKGWRIAAVSPNAEGRLEAYLQRQVKRGALFSR